MRDKGIYLIKATRVEQQFEPVACRQFSTLTLGVYAPLPSTEESFFSFRFERGALVF